ncbi:hypothetical protein CBL_08612 [Carabus blaptoides fortunei]
MGGMSPKMLDAKRNILAHLFDIAFIRAAIITTAITGVWPYNPNIFTDADFIAAETTNVHTPVVAEIAKLPTAITAAATMITTAVAAEPTIIPNMTAIDQSVLSSKTNLGRPPSPPTPGCSIWEKDRNENGTDTLKVHPRTSEPKIAKKRTSFKTSKMQQKLSNNTSSSSSGDEVDAEYLYCGYLYSQSDEGWEQAGIHISSFSSGKANRKNIFIDYSQNAQSTSTSDITSESTIIESDSEERETISREQGNESNAEQYAVESSSSEIEKDVICYFKKPHCTNLEDFFKFHPKQPCERLLSVVNSQLSTGQSFYELVKELLEANDVDIHRCIGNSTDGAANMQGKYKGFSTWLVKEVPDQIHIWCYAHILNLVISDITQQKIAAPSLFGLLNTIAVFIRESYQRMNVWDSISNDSKRRKLASIGETMWWAKESALIKIFGNFDPTNFSHDIPNEAFKKLSSILIKFDISANPECIRSELINFSSAWNQLKNTVPETIEEQVIDIDETTTDDSHEVYKSSLHEKHGENVDGGLDPLTGEDWAKAIITT